MENFTVMTEEKGASVNDPKRPGYWVGTGVLGGPMFSDRDRTRRSPSNPEIVELYRSLVYICTRINFNAFSRQTLRLYAMTKGGQSRIRLLDHQTNSVPWFQKEYIKSLAHLNVYTRGIQEIEEITEHPLLAAVSHPNPRWDHISLMRYVSMCLDLFGFSHWWMEGFEGVRTDNVWPLLSQYMRPQKQGEYELVEYFNYGMMQIPYAEVMEVREISARDPYALGCSPAQASFAHADLFDMFVSYERNLFEQGAAPRLIISNKDAESSLGPREREKLQRDINYSLVRGQQGIAWVVDGALTVTPVSFLPEGMAKLNIGNESMQRVANSFGVPVSMVDIGNANRSISESDKKTHLEQAIDPRCALVASALTKWTRQQGRDIDTKLKAAGSRVRTGFDRLVWAFDNPVPEDEERKAKIFDMYLRNSSMTINEVRISRGLEPVWYGEEAYMQIALTTPSIAKEQRAQGQVGRDGKPRSGAVPMNMPGGGPPPKEQPALPKPADDELEEGEEEEVVKPKPKPKKSLPAPVVKRPARFADEWDLAEALVRAALLDIGLGHEDKYEDEVITPEQRLEALHALRINCASLMRGLGEKAFTEFTDAIDEQEEKAFGKKAKGVLSAFFKNLRKSVKAGILSAALLAFGPGEPTVAELKAIDEATTVQIEYLEKFKSETFDGSQVMDGTFAARAEMYGRSMWNSGGNLIQSVAKGSGLFTQARRWHTYPDEPCADCQDEIDKEWHPIEEVLALGNSICRGSCHCFLSWRTEDGQEWIAGRGPLDELAFGSR